MRKLLSIFLVSCLSILSVSGSSAHVTILSSFPEQFANVNPIPTQVWIEFSGELQTLEGEAVNSLEIVDSTGIAVNVGDPIISGGRISTKVSGQSAPGVFEVKYRVVGDDGHVIEGEYTFNASPDYSAEQTPMPISALPEESSNPAGGILLGLMLLLFFGGIFLRAKNRRK
ncbi:MAG: copper resistance protein CopC [Candidatus Planktophila sp.]|jgi:methionine-rich copper-binding protein CopC|nr:copper resistance protein CopC [Candidatus Planktophila sp.]